MITLYLLIVSLILIIIILATRKKKQSKQVKHDTSFLNNYKNLPEHIRLYLHEHPNSMRVSIEDNQAYYLKYKTQNSQGITYIILCGYRRIK